MRSRTAIQPVGVPIRMPIHPGRFLERHFMRPLALTQTRTAQLLGVSRRRVNELTQGHRAMSADTAIRCAVAFGVRADFWLALQANWDSFHAWRDLRHQPDAAPGIARRSASLNA